MIFFAIICAGGENMQRYNVNKTKLVIIPLDGTIFDLNRYRYNYYNHLCNDKGLKLSKQDFYDHLSNMYDMYKTLPLSGKVDTGPLNAKIERELSQYLQNKGIKPKEGFSELLEYLHQKGINVAVMSTHRTKDAVAYLQAAKLYNKVQFIIGSDTTSLPLPSTQILETILNYFQASPVETLVISSFASLNHAAVQLHLNVVFCNDLIEAGFQERQTSYKVTNNLFEVLNILLFDKYEDAEIYSPILGMSANMNKDQLDNIHNRLQETYKDDSKVMDLVNQTYQYHVSQLTDQPERKEVVNQHFSFDEDDESSHDSVIEETIQEEKEEIISESIEETKHVNTLDMKEQEELTALLKQINKKEPTDEPTVKKVTDFNEIKEIVKEAQPKEEKQVPYIVSILVNILYVFAVSFLIMFIGVIVYIAFIHQFEVNEGIFNIMTNIFNTYYSFIEMLFKTFLNSLHSLLSFIPNYESYELSNMFFSPEGVKFFNIFLFHSLIIGVIKGIFYFIHKGQDNEDNYE